MIKYTFILGDSYTTAVGSSSRPRKVVEVTCPRASCKETFVVVKSRWWKSSEYQTRPCPYCFKASALP